MSALIVIIPLFDGNMAVKAYKLGDHDSEIALDIRDDFRGRPQIYYMPGLELVQQLGLETFSGDMPLFVDANRFHVLNGMFANKSIPPDKLILNLNVPGMLPADDELLTGLKEIKEQGYGLALRGWPEEGLENPMYGFADHIILDFRDKKFRDRLNAVRRRHPDKGIIFSHLPDMEAYLEYSPSPNTLFTGDFYNNPITSGSSEISPLKANAFRLLRQINEDDFELRNIAGTIERDPSLSISLLRFINSAAVGLRSKVSSINGAVAILGQKEVRRWATVALSVEIFLDRPSEIVRLSLVRAKFAENLAGLFELGVFQNSLFLTGLFSLLDVILEKPMEEAVKEVAVDNLVREALVNRSGNLYKVLDFMYAYERADWNKVSIITINSDIKGAAVGQAFVDALTWYHQLLDSIDAMEENESSEDTEK